MKIEWNKKDDLLAEQTFAHLRKYAPVFTSFATTAQIELLLLQKVGPVVLYKNMEFSVVVNSFDRGTTGLDFQYPRFLRIDKS